MAPDTRRLAPRIEEGDRLFRDAEESGQLTAGQRDAFLAEALRGLAEGYTADAAASTFRVLVSPMVTWIWIGAIVVFAGGLIALWPAPRGASRRASAAYAARVGREVRIPA